MKRVCIVVAITSVFVLVPLTGQINSPLFLYEKSELVIETEDGATATFKVVVVSRSEDLAQGLMNVQFMPLDQGMVFLHSTKREVSMWMKNTHISLDMWFVSETGLVTRVVSKTHPESTDLIRSNGPVVAVVEVNAGLSSLIGVTTRCTASASCLFKRLQGLAALHSYSARHLGSTYSLQLFKIYSHSQTLSPD